MVEDRGRVAIVSQNYPPDKMGNASRISDTSEHLEAEGWDVTVLAPPPAFPHGQFDRTWERKSTSEEGGVIVHRLWAWQPTVEDPSFLSRMAYYVLFPIHALIWLIWNQEEYDVILTSSPPIFTGVAGLPMRLLAQKPWIVDVRDLWIDASVGLGFIEEGGLAERISRHYERWVLSTADRITVTTSVLGDTLADQYGLDREKIFHLPNGVDTDKFESGESDPESIIIYTGNIGHAQDLESCIRAMARMENSEAKLKIVGDGDIKEELEDLVQRKGLGESVEFTGLVEREEVPKILDNAMIGIAPLKSDDTLEYAVPTKAYEYMASELPVVATGIGEIVSLIDESNGGVLVSNDPDEIASTFDRLTLDQERREYLGENGRKHVIEKYDRKKVAKKLDKLLNELSQ